MPAEITLELPNIRLAARVWGPEDGLPVLALHGWLDNAATFDRLAPLLPQCRIVALDHAGHGLSEHRGHGTYYLLDYVADALAAATALGWSRYALLGHSLGAGVAALCAGTYPDRILKLALVEGLAPLTSAPQDAPSNLRTALDREARGPRVGERSYPTVEAAAAARTRATGLKPDAARILVERALHPVEDGWRWRTDPRLRWPSRIRLTSDQVNAFLSAITCPVKLLSAAQGIAFDPAVVAERCACIRDLEIAELRGSHHLHLEDPEPVGAALAGFLGPRAATATSPDAHPDAQT